MAERGGGSIINIGSIQGCVGPDYTLYDGLGWGIPPDYFFHKGGLLQLTRFAASKLGPPRRPRECDQPRRIFRWPGRAILSNDTTPAHSSVAWPTTRTSKALLCFWPQTLHDMSQERILRWTAATRQSSDRRQKVLSMPDESCHVLVIGSSVTNDAGTNSKPFMTGRSYPVRNRFSQFKLRC